MMNNFLEQLKNLLEQHKHQPDELVRQCELLAQKATTVNEDLCILNLQNILEAFHEQQRVKRLTYFSKIQTLDDISGGFATGEITVIGGRPGMGKTQFLLYLAINLSSQAPVLYLNLDLNEHQLHSRIVNMLVPQDDSIPQINNITDVEYCNHLKLNEFQQHCKLYVARQLNGKISQILDYIEKAIEENHIRIICLDYLQLIYAQFKSKYRDTEIYEIMRTLKQWAIKKNVCIIITSQLSRAVETRGGSKIPILSDFRDSGSIEEMADKVLFIFRYEYYNIDFDENGNTTDNMVQLLVAKNKTGATGTVQLIRNNDFTTFQEFQKEQTLFSYKDNPFID